MTTLAVIASLAVAIVYAAYYVHHVIMDWADSATASKGWNQQLSTFGWCQTGQHGQCPKRVTHWHFAKQKVGRKVQEVIVYDEKPTKCDCWCHTKSTGNSGKKVKKKK
jgi:hypothetical protein